jgi:hypothetical protein
LPQGTAVPALHWPFPHVEGGVYALALHAPALHIIPDGTCAQAPFAPHKPVSPQGDAVHWLAGTGAVPAFTLPHVPSAPPFSAAVHAWQVVLQAVLQQTPFAQLPLAHSAVFLQAWPSAAGPHVLFFVQLPLGQSLSCAHATQLPLPSQTLPLPHGLSAPLLLIWHVPLLQVAVVQLFVAVQSLFIKQPTQLPLPSHCWSLPQLVPDASLFCCGTPPLHAPT